MPVIFFLQRAETFTNYLSVGSGERFFDDFQPVYWKFSSEFINENYFYQVFFDDGGRRIKKMLLDKLLW